MTKYRFPEDVIKCHWPGFFIETTPKKIDLKPSDSPEDIFRKLESYKRPDLYDTKLERGRPSHFEYLMGYIVSAAYLTTKCIKVYNEYRYLEFPIIFSCRHYIEIAFKIIIYYGDKILNQSSINLTNLFKTHNIQSLYNKAFPIISKIFDDHQQPIEKELIEEWKAISDFFNKIDVNGEKYRYWVDTSGTVHSPTSVITLEELCEKMSTLVWDFHCVLLSLDEFSEYKYRIYPHTASFPKWLNNLGVLMHETFEGDKRIVSIEIGDES